MEQNKFLTAFSDFDGAPKNWKMIDDEQGRAPILDVNPRYKQDSECSNNCVNCVMAYELRMRGYDVVAKSKKECNVSAKAESMWYDVKKNSARLFSDVIASIEHAEGARYFLGLSTAKQTGHAVVLEYVRATFYLIDPQKGSKIQVSENTPMQYMAYTFWRIDNLDITQTGYNACKGRDS